uniref:Maturation n=1 Tax=Leviviridae sp. TaxID=2027243 RepID=A0A514D8C6_9VIRU|nr:MAG: hypothetical protein H2RhizoLitter493893_000004 [Leviviridae sp.]
MTSEFYSLTIPGHELYRTWDNSTNPFPGRVYWDTPRSVGSGYLSRNSGKTPGFALLRSTGKLPQNAFSFSEYLRTDLVGYNESWTRNAFGLVAYARTEGRVASFTGSVPSFLPLASLMEANVRAKLMDKLRDSDIDIGTFAGEFKETAHMFLTFARALVLAVKAARRRDMKGVAYALGIKPESAKDFANAWLMIKYGVQPFVSDILGASKALEKGLQKERYYLIHAGTVFEDTITDVVGVSNSGSGRIETIWTYKVQVGGRVKYSISNAKVSTLASLGLLNPLAVGWELTKLSFVFDWAIGIGSWLGQLDVTSGKSFDNGSLTTYISKKATQSWDQCWIGASGDYGSNTQASASYSDVSVTRTPLASWPINFVPAFKDPRSLSHIVTALSLLRQRY